MKKGPEGKGEDDGNLGDVWVSGFRALGAWGFRVFGFRSGLLGFMALKFRVLRSSSA